MTCELVGFELAGTTSLSGTVVSQDRPMRLLLALEKHQTACSVKCAKWYAECHLFTSCKLQMLVLYTADIGCHLIWNFAKHFQCLCRCLAEDKEAALQPPEVEIA